MENGNPEYWANWEAGRSLRNNSLFIRTYTLSETLTHSKALVVLSASQPNEENLHGFQAK